MRGHLWPGLLLAVLGIAGGCGEASGTSNGNGDGGPSGGAAIWKQRCQAVVGHNAMCGKGSKDQAAVDQCVATQNCEPSTWSTVIVDKVMGCLATLPCSHPDDECISQSAPQLTPTTNALLAACRDKAAACPGFDGCLETLFLVSDGLANKLQTCLGKTCDAAGACMLNEYSAAVVAAGCLGELPFGG